MKMIKGIVFVIVAALFIVIFTPASARAVTETGREEDQKIDDGVWEATVYLTDSFDQNVRAHILRIGHDAAVSFKVSTADYYAEGNTASDRDKKAEKWEQSSWGYATVEEQAEHYNLSADKKGSVIAGVNGDFYLKDLNGETIGRLIMEGHVINSSTQEPFFAVMKDGSCAVLDGSTGSDGIEEAVAGSCWLLRDGSVVGAKGDKYTQTSIGVTADGDVVIAVIDGREPTSPGSSQHDLGSLMKQQGCTDAILLDCGGSASFLTKRADDQGVVYRNTATDGVPRPVSSALLIVKNDKAASTAAKDVPVLSMKEKNTYLDSDDEKTQFLIDGKAQTGFRMINDTQYLFDNDGKGVTQDITIGNTEYSFVNGKLETVSDKDAGRVVIGYCGEDEDGRNLVYAYHFGDHMLNIGLNSMISDASGRMKNWGDVNEVPWQTEKHRVRTVVVGEGVKNIGDFFLRFTPYPFNDALNGVDTELTSVELPSSLKTIGKEAFLNHANLKRITIPEKVKKICTSAFEFDTDTAFTFKGSEPPKMSKKSFGTGKDKEGSWVMVPDTDAWRDFSENKDLLKDSGFNRQILFAESTLTDMM